MKSLLRKFDVEKSISLMPDRDKLTDEVLSGFKEMLSKFDFECYDCYIDNCPNNELIRCVIVINVEPCLDVTFSYFYDGDVAFSINLEDEVIFINALKSEDFANYLNEFILKWKQKKLDWLS